MPRSSIPHKDEQKLWRLAASRCSFNECDAELIKEEKGGMLGEMAHIVAESEKGPRGLSELTSEERNSYDNLILLCSNHHNLIDNNEKDWPVEKLIKMKQDHERWVAKQLSKGKGWKVNIQPWNFYYINLRRLLLDPTTVYENNNLLENIHSFNSPSPLSQFDMEKFLQLRMLVEVYLSKWHPPVLSLDEISEGTVGARVKFEAKFWTKNVPAPRDILFRKLRGNVKYDPHIHLKIKQRKIYVLIDPWWITSDTAFTLLKSGSIEVSGLGIVTKVSENEVYITPIVMGTPDFLGSEIITGRKFGEFDTSDLRGILPRTIPQLDYD